MDALVAAAMQSARESELSPAPSMSDEQASDSGISCDDDSKESATTVRNLKPPTQCRNNYGYEPIPKRARRAKVQDLTPQMAERMREVNRIAAQRHRRIAKDKRKQLDVKLVSSARCNQALRAEHDTLCAEKTKLRSLVHTLYSPGTPRHHWLTETKRVSAQSTSTASVSLPAHPHLASASTHLIPPSMATSRTSTTATSCAMPLGSLPTASMQSLPSMSMPHFGVNVPGMYKSMLPGPVPLMAGSMPPMASCMPSMASFGHPLSANISLLSLQYQQMAMLQMRTDQLKRSLESSACGTSVSS
eukprot:m.20915 g.20915  ORF g.20915 m.20915 type:complete len:303 (-) comp11068_c0_seq1:110-1018(-)